MSKLPAFDICLALEVIEVVPDFCPIKSIKFDCVELKRVEMVCLIANEWYFPCFFVCRNGKLHVAMECYVYTIILFIFSGVPIGAQGHVPL